MYTSIVVITFHLLTKTLTLTPQSRPSFTNIKPRPHHHHNNNMGATEQNAPQEIDEKCRTLHITSPSAMGPDNPPDGVDTVKKNQKKESSSQEYKKAKAMARKV